MSPTTLKVPALLVICSALASCATGPGSTTPSQPYVLLDQARALLPLSSPECVAQNLKPGEPFPASEIPPSALSNKLSGWVAMRYDVVAGLAQNIIVVESRPTGLYDAAALKHAARYRDPKGATVRGCVMTIEVKF